MENDNYSLTDFFVWTFLAHHNSTIKSVLLKFTNLTKQAFYSLSSHVKLMVSCHMLSVIVSNIQYNKLLYKPSRCQANSVSTETAMLQSRIVALMCCKVLVSLVLSECCQWSKLRTVKRVIPPKWTPIVGCNSAQGRQFVVSRVLSHALSKVDAMWWHHQIALPEMNEHFMDSFRIYIKQLAIFEYYGERCLHNCDSVLHMGTTGHL